MAAWLHHSLAAREVIRSCRPILHRARLAAEGGFGWQMHEQHAGRAADRARAMTVAADIVSKEYFAAAAPVLSPIAGFDFECTGKHDEKLAPGGRMPILIE